MKDKILKTAFLFSLMVLVISCEEDRLDLNNPNALTTGQFWETPNDAN